MSDAYAAKEGGASMYNNIVASDIIQNSLLTLWGNVAAFLPRFVAAIIVFLIGWLVAIVLAKLVWHVVKAIQLDRALESVGFKAVWEKSGHKLDSAFFFYELVKWFFLVVFLMSATNILGLDRVTDFLYSVVLYLPNVIVAAIILIIGVLIARFAEKLVRGSIRATEFGSANTLALITRWAVLVFTALAVLGQLGFSITGDIARIIITGIIAAASLALGLAFGLGGRDHADEYLAKLKKHIHD